MKKMRKQLVLAIGAAAVIGLSGIQLAGAAPPRGGMGGGPGYGCALGQQPLSEKEIQAREQFLAETTAVRRQVATKNAELNALMAQTNPDAKKVAALTGELFDLRSQLREKAVAAGLPGGFGMRNCRGYGMGQGHGGGYGMGPGHGGGYGMMTGGPWMQNGPAPQAQGQ